MINLRKSLCFLIPLMFFLIASDSAAQKKPNIIVVLADDMGFSDLGCYVTKNYVNCTLSLNQTDMPYFFNTSEELILWYFNN